MEGKLSVEKGKDGFIFIVFTVKQREDVNVFERYESCVLCNEKIGIKMITYQE